MKICKRNAAKILRKGEEEKKELPFSLTERRISVEK